MKQIERLFVLPVPQTVEYLKTIFMGCPFDIDWDTLGVEVGTRVCEHGARSIERKPVTRVYHAVPGSMNVWYDTASGHSSLLLPLFPSKKLGARHDEIGDAWNRPYFRPVLSFGIAPPLRRNIRGFVNSLATALVDTSPVLGFWCESTTVEEMTSPEFGNFYTDYVSQGAVNNQVLLELDEGVE